MEINLSIKQEMVTKEDEGSTFLYVRHYEIRNKI